MASTDPVPDVPPTTGTTTVTTTAPLFGLFGGSSSTTTIPATPETTAAAVTSVTPPQPEQPSPKTTQMVIGEVTSTFLWAFTVALTACTLYLAALNVGVTVPVWVLLLLAFVPFTGWISAILLIGTTIFSGPVNVNVLRGRTLSEVFGIRTAPKSI
jgi:hypothetical protein